MEDGWSEVRFFDDRYPARSHCAVWPISGTTEALLKGDHHAAVVAIGRNSLRLDLTDRLAAASQNLAIIVHPRAWVSSRASVGSGSVILAGAMVNIGARLGRATIINTNATIDHDCIIGDGVHVSPGANLAGGVSVGATSWIGVGAAVREGIRIGRDVVIGAGAVVVKDVADGVTIVGNPADRTLPRR